MLADWNNKHLYVLASISTYTLLYTRRLGKILKIPFTFSSSYVLKKYTTIMENVSITKSLFEPFSFCNDYDDSIPPSPSVEELVHEILSDIVLSVTSAAR